MRKCKHFTGLGSDECKKGIKYKSFEQDNESIMYSIPCVELGKTDQIIARQECKLCEFPTEEEERAKEKEQTALISKTIALYGAIKDHIKKTGLTSGSIVCPHGDHKANFMSADSDGHIWARCKTCDLTFNE